jgi:hypothetical protein
MTLTSKPLQRCRLAPRAVTVQTITLELQEAITACSMATALPSLQSRCRIGCVEDWNAGVCFPVMSQQRL